MTIFNFMSRFADDVSSGGKRRPPRVGKTLSGYLIKW